MKFSSGVDGNQFKNASATFQAALTYHIAKKDCESKPIIPNDCHERVEDSLHFYS